MASRYQPGDSIAQTREMVRIHLPSCIAQRGECGCSMELFPQPWRYYIKRAGVQIDISETEHTESLQDYRRQRDADGTSPEAVENVASWVAAGLTDTQMEQAFALIYGEVATNRAFFNAIRTRFRAARG